MFLLKWNSKKNRRIAPRYELPMAVYTEEGYDYKEKLLNISETGCCMETPVELGKGEHVLLHFIASNSFCAIEDSFCLDGSIVWSSHDSTGYRYGIHFVESTKDFFVREQTVFREHLAKSVRVKSAKEVS